MKTIICEQNTPEWLAARTGIPTASEFYKIYTPGGKLSTQSDAYENVKLMEIITGTPSEGWEGNKWSDRGKTLEPEAANWYSAQNETDLMEIGFCTDDAGTMGCSPDRLVGEEGLLEIKCLSPQVHITVALKGKFETKHYSQLQGQLLVTGRKWVDILCYYPGAKSLVTRVPRDEAYLAGLSSALRAFNERVRVKHNLLIANGFAAA